jgi:hypothetical protein
MLRFCNIGQRSMMDVVSLDGLESQTRESSASESRASSRPWRITGDRQHVPR